MLKSLIFVNSIFPFQAVPLTKSSTRNASTVSQLSSRKAYALTLSKESIKKFLRENPIKLFNIGCM
uniref:Uncharacterized protein n=1 Tax=Populus trichocarpa TaxID=3694 RepID=A0A2K2AUH9_POPTR